MSLFPGRLPRYFLSLSLGIDQTPRTGQDHRASWIAFGLIGALIVAVYGHTLSGYFIGEDFAYISLYANFPLNRWPGLFVQDWSQGIWGVPQPELRPLLALSFMVDGLIWGGQAFGYRALNLVLHIICSCLVYVVAHRLLRSSLLVAFAAAILFAVHPCHVQPVVWITGRVDLLPTLFCLASLLAFARFRHRAERKALAASYLFYLGAVFSKEYGLMLPLLIAAYDVTRPGSVSAPPESAKAKWITAVTPYLGFLLVLVIYYVCRRNAFSPDLATPGLPELRHLASQQVEYWRYLLAPLERLTEAAIGPWREAAPLWQFCSIALGALLLMILVVLALRLGRRQAGPGTMPLMFCGPVWFVVTTLPLGVTYISERHLYLTSAGLCLFLAEAAGTIFDRRRWRWCFPALTLVVAAVWTYETAAQIAPWKRAGSITKRARAEIGALPETPPGTVLILDFPTRYQNAWLFSWSSPFLLDHPFFQPALHRHFVVLEPPDNYYRPDDWKRKPDISRVSDVRADAAFLISYLPGEDRFETRRLDPARLQAVSRVLQVGWEIPPPPPNSSWEQFLAILKN